jgi:hypothetical protein
MAHCDGLLGRWFRSIEAVIGRVLWPRIRAERRDMCKMLAVMLCVTWCLIIVIPERRNRSRGWSMLSDAPCTSVNPDLFLVEHGARSVRVSNTF